MPIKAMPWLALAVVLLSGIAGWQGYVRGVADCEAKHVQETLDRIEAGQKLEAARRVVAAERDQLARKLEEAAYADPVTVHRCLGPDRVRRLNAIK